MSLLAPGQMAPRFPARVIELLSIAPAGLLWLAEKVDNRQRVFIAEYEPKGGGKAALRDFNLRYQRLKTLPPDLLPVLDTRYGHEERLFLVFKAPAGQSAKKVLESGRTMMPAQEFLNRLLSLTRQFNEALSGASHGWIRAETVTVQPEGKLLLGPPAFAPGEAPDPQSDLRHCALMTAQWAGIPLRHLDADAEQCNVLRKAEDWALAAAMEWMLFCKDRAPQSAERVIEFLRDAVLAPKGDSETELSTALDTLKSLYQRSVSTIIKREIEKTEQRLSSIRRVPQPQPQSEPHKPESNPTAVPQSAPPAAPPTLPPSAVETSAPPATPSVDLAQQSAAQRVAALKALSADPVPPPVSAPPPAPPPPKKSGLLWKGAALALGVAGAYYYVSNGPQREFNEYLDKQQVVSANGTSAYTTYQKAVREKGPESSTVKSMNEKALPVLQKISKEAFDSWYKDSELSKPPDRRVPGEMAVTTWEEMVQIQEWLSIILKSPMSNARYAYARGMAATIRRAWEEARQQFDDALRGQPNWSLALNGLGKAYFGLRQFDNTEKYYRLACEADPAWYFPHANLGALYRDVLRNFDSSEREYRAAIQLDPNRPSFHFNFGLLYYLRGKQYWSSACSEFRTALSLPNNRSLSPAEVKLATQRRDKACQAK